MKQTDFKPEVFKPGWHAPNGEYCVMEAVHGPVFLVGPSVCGNFYGLERHELRRERELLHPFKVRREEPLSKDADPFEMVHTLLKWGGYYGIEFRLGDEPVARVMREEMGV